MTRLDQTQQRKRISCWLAWGLSLSLISYSGLAFAKGFKPKPGIGQAGQRVGLASRGGCQVEADSPPLTTLVPVDNGLTASEYPTFFWYMPDHSYPSVEFRLIADDSEMGPQIVHRRVFETLPERQVVSYLLPSDQVAPLTAGQDYKWQVILVCNPDMPAGNIFAEGWIRYQAPSLALKQQIAVAANNQKSDLWLSNSYWYDAIQVLSSELQTRPKNAAALQQWNELMKQDTVNLSHLVKP